jgi:DNA-binding beta-propeller fold protein YncE
MPSRASNFTLVWSQWGVSIKNISGSLNYPFSVFVSMTGDVYIDNGYANGQVDKFLFNTSMVVNVMNVNGSCYGLFIDMNNYLYCSLKNFHQVVKLLLNNGTTPTIAAGTGLAGSQSNMLNAQQGIYVDNNLNLYVADCGNNRIQVFQSGQLIALTAAGSGATGTITLNYPTGVVLDTDGYLFIVDSNNHRIVASGLNGFRCIIGCSGGGSTSSQLYFPQSMAFDSYGNIYVADRGNSRIQTFILQKTNCCKLF